MRQFTILWFLLIGQVAHGVLCPEGAIPGFTEEGRAACYLFERFPAQFLIAENLCRGAGGHLTSVNDLSVNEFVAQGGAETFEILNVDDFWIGAHDLEDPGAWEWLDGTEFLFTNWAVGEPNHKKRDRCGAMNLSNGSWVATNCYALKPYVCEVETLNSSTSVQPPILTTESTPAVQSSSVFATTQLTRKRCDPKWSYLEETDRCYKIVKDRTECTLDPYTSEATIHSETENKFIGQLADKVQKKNLKIRLSAVQKYWVRDNLADKQDHSLKSWLQQLELKKMFSVDKIHSKRNKKSSRSKVDFQWPDGSPLDFTNWARDQPKGGAYICVELNTCLGNKCEREEEKYLWVTTSCLYWNNYGVCSKSAK